MKIYSTEEEQVEAIKGWWDKNSSYVLIFLVVMVVSSFGGQAWRKARIADQETASSDYAAMIVAQDKDDKVAVRARANAIISDFPGVLYASFAALTLAKVEFEEGKTGEAIKHLQWILQNGKQDELKHIARLRSGKILLSEKKAAEALEVLKTSEEGEFMPVYLELRGDIYYAMGDRQKARQSWDKAFILHQSAGTDTSFLKMKRDDLGKDLESENIVTQKVISHATSTEQTDTLSENTDG